MFKIYVDRLKNGHTEKIDITSSCDFLDIHEAELSFGEKLEVQGDAYLTKDHLILHLKAHIDISLPCKICNQTVRKEINLKNVYVAEALENIKGGIYDYSDKLREAILIEVPSFIECNEGNCPSREEIKDFFSRSDVDFPFKNLQQE